MAVGLMTLTAALDEVPADYMEMVNTIGMEKL